MRVPQTPPTILELLEEVGPKRMQEVLSVMAVNRSSPEQTYRHWDKLRHLKPPENLNVREWWLVEKLGRNGALKPIGLVDRRGNPFQFAVPQQVAEELHQIDLRAGGLVSVPDPIANPRTRDQYVITSLMEEAITSSQLEGAATTRKVAKEMIQTGRQPRDTSEQMILNNYITMQRIRKLKESPLTPELVLEIHKLVTDRTLNDPSAAGRFCKAGEERIVGDDTGTIFHEPPPVEQLPDRMKEMCAFANGQTPDYFVHPAVRAIILHFWLAYDHPFVDGNGRTARALFYWSMLRGGYWLFEFISISTILRRAPVQYGRSFLYTETDDNDLTYFLVAQTQVIRRAIRGLHEYIERKTEEIQLVQTQMRTLDYFNHRQAEVIRHALRNPGQRYTIASHQKSHGVAYQTARTDLLDLAENGILRRLKKANQFIFEAPPDLPERLQRLENKEAAATESFS